MAGLTFLILALTIERPMLRCSFVSTQRCCLSKFPANSVRKTVDKSSWLLSHFIKLSWI